MRQKLLIITTSAILLSCIFGIIVENNSIAESEAEPINGSEKINRSRGTIIVDCNGNGNYTKIQDAINVAKPGYTIHVWEGTYYENLIVDKNISLIGNGTSDTIINGSGKNIVIKVTSDWVNISGFAIDNYRKGNGIEVYYSNNCKIQNCNCSNNSNGILLAYSNYNILKNNTCTSNARYGIYIGDSNYNLINNNNCNSNVYCGIHLEYSSNNTIKNNKCCFNKGDGIYLFRSPYNFLENNYCSDNGDGVAIRYSSFIKMFDNIMNGCSFYLWGNHLNQWNTHTISLNNSVNGKPIYYFKNVKNKVMPSGVGQIIIANCENIIIQNQKIEDTKIAISLAFSSSNILKNNNCSNNNGGIYLFRSSKNVLINNTFISNKYLGGCLYHIHESGYGIKSQGSKDNLIENNYNLNNTYAIDLDYSDSHMVVNNTCLNGYMGVSIVGSDLNTICNNKCSNNEYGIFLAYSISNTLTNNSCILNNNSGIFFEVSRSNFIKFNNVSNNNFGMALFGLDIKHFSSNNNTFFENYISFNSDFGLYIPYNCMKNKIFHNNFISNDKQVFDEGQNFWNNSASEGNYWSDYVGSDNSSNGRVAGDGIGDTNLPHQNLDFYPFIKPWGWQCPGIPILVDPGDVYTGSSYTLFWNKTRGALGYVLEEAGNEKFKSSTIIYKGSENLINITDKNEGRYFYRVKAYNTEFESNWSNYIDIEVITRPNLPPKINQSIKSIKIFEDSIVIVSINLNDWFIDPEGATLIFKARSNINISVKILDNGSVELTPKKDWNGNVTVTFSANDTINEIEDKLIITVMGVNDPPEEPEIIQPTKGESFLNSTKINFTGSCFDVDEIYGDVLSYTWTSNISGVIGFGKKLVGKLLPPGSHQITLIVTDLLNESNETYITINIDQLDLNGNANKTNTTDNNTDSDNDMMPDFWERKFGLNITDPTDAGLDPDFDGLTNLEEFLNQTNPLDSDTDHDGFYDGIELENGTNPLDDEDFPIEKNEDEEDDREKEENKIDFVVYAVLIVVIIIYLILIATYIFFRRKKEKRL